MSNSLDFLPKRARGTAEWRWTVPTRLVSLIPLSFRRSVLGSCGRGVAWRGKHVRSVAGGHVSFRRSVVGSCGRGVAG